MERIIHHNEYNQGLGLTTCSFKAQGIIIIIIIIIIACHRFSFFPGTSPLEPVVNLTTQASSLSL
jgi:hypothetical protein